MAFLLVLMALAVGIVLPMQAGINSQLRIWVGHPIQAALISFSVGTLVLITSAAALRLPWPSVSHLGQAPWWVWLGGLFGATYVSMAVVLAPRLGAAALIGASVAGQLIGSLLLDHYGVVGYAVRPVSMERIVGVVLLLTGVLLIQRF